MTSRAALRAPKSKKARRAMRRGLRLRVACAAPCRVRAVLRYAGKRIGKSKAVRIVEGRTRTVRVRLSRRRYRALLAEMRRSRLRRVKVTAVTKVGTADGKRTIRRTVRLKR